MQSSTVVQLLMQTTSSCVIKVLYGYRALLYLWRKKSVTPCVEIYMLAANFETIPFEDAQTARLSFGGAVQG